MKIFARIFKVEEFTLYEREITQIPLTHLSLHISSEIFCREILKALSQSESVKGAFRL